MLRLFISSIVLLFLSACFHDPHAKFEQGMALFENGEVIAAEKLLQEALEELEELKDDNALGDMYGHYGAMIASPQYRKHEKSLRELGSYDPSSQTAIQYLMKSLAHYDKANNPEGLRYTTFHLAEIYLDDGNQEKACYFYDQSIIFHQKAMQSSSNGVMIQRGYTSWEAMVADYKKDAACPSPMLPDTEDPESRKYGIFSVDRGMPAHHSPSRRGKSA